MGTSKKVIATIKKEAKQNTKNVSTFNNFMMMMGDVVPANENNNISSSNDNNDGDNQASSSSKEEVLNENGKRHEQEEEKEQQQSLDKKPPKRIKKSKEERFMEKQQKIRDDIQQQQQSSSTSTLASSTSTKEIEYLKKELEMVKEELENRDAELKIQEKLLRKSKKETKDLQRELKSMNYKTNPKATRSIAIPNDILDDLNSEEMKTYLVEMIARTLVLFSIDEVIVYRSTKATNSTTDKLCKLLEFIDMPKNIRHHLYDLNDMDYQYVDKLKRMESAQHSTTNRWTKYREGIVLEKVVGKSSLVDVGLGEGKEIKIDKELQPGTRVTLEMEEEIGKQFTNANQYRKGKVVSPSDVRHDGQYWGYQVRMVDSIENVFNESSFNSYDYKILFTCNVHENQSVQELKQKQLKEKQLKEDESTSEFDNNVESYQHLLIIFAEREQEILGLLKQGLESTKDDNNEDDSEQDSEEEEDNKEDKKETTVDKSLDKIIDLQSENTLKSKRIRFEETLLIGLSSLLNKVI